MSTTNFSNDPVTAPGGPDLGAPQGASDDESGAKDQAKQAAGTAADQGKRVAGVAQDEVKNVAAEAQTQLRGLLDEATTQVDEQSKAQKSRLADTVRTFGDDLESMRGEAQQDGVAAQVVQQVAGQARSLASHLDDRNPSELLDDVRRFARRRPGTFLLGALAAGIVVGRVSRGAKAAQDRPSSGAVEPTLAGADQSPRSAPVVETGVAPVVDDVQVGYTDADFGAVGAQSDLGTKGVEMSETGVTGTDGIRS
jgi:hypothetical protein